MHETFCLRGGNAASAMTTGPGLIADRDRIGSEVNDLVVRHLFSAGLALQTALGLLDGHRAGENVQHALAELDQAIISIRNALFGRFSTDSPGDGTPG
jgi:signal transduction histidine kinase